MVGEAVEGELLELGARATVIGVGVDGDASSWGEDTGYFDVAWVH